MTDMKAPFPWFGGKSRVAHIVWPRFGDTLNYVEPFAGSLAVLLKRPTEPRTETVNDRDTYLANFWRATQADPEAVACYADWPVNEADLHARHLWLVNQADFREQMMTDPDYYDAKIAGWWVWGQSAWIGSGWCDTSKAPSRQTPLLFGNRNGEQYGSKTINGRSRPNLRPAQGVNGVPVKRPQLSRPGRGVPGGGYEYAGHGDLYAYMDALAARLRRVRVVCGDWKRIMGPSVTYKIGVTAVFLDPPYGDTRQDNLYAVDSLTVADEVRAWCLEEIDDSPAFIGPRYLHPKLRIALCGLDGEHNELEALGWDVVAWKTNGGYANQRKTADNANAGRERIWFSPNCLAAKEAARQLQMEMPLC